jgi:cysteinyl-tRNA synthetase
MAWRHLGEAFDIHGGGIDLVFPHHENEIAQSRCAFHTPVMANVWMHNGFLQVEGEKMSKSLGNFATIREVLADWQGDVIRLAMLSAHYTKPINWTVKGLEEAEKALADFFDAASADAEPRPASGVLDALADDLNTPKAIAEMHGLKNAAGRKALAGTLAFFGFRASGFSEWREAHAPAPGLGVDEIERRIAERLTARKMKEFAEADRIRDELAAKGIVLKDTKDGTTWEVAR